MGLDLLVALGNKVMDPPCTIDNSENEDSKLGIDMIIKSEEIILLGKINKQKLFIGLFLLFLSTYTAQTGARKPIMVRRFQACTDLQTSLYWTLFVY